MVDLNTNTSVPVRAGQRRDQTSIVVTPTHHATLALHQQTQVMKVHVYDVTHIQGLPEKNMFSRKLLLLSQKTPDFKMMGR